MRLLFTRISLNIRLMYSWVKGEGRKMKLLEARDAYTRVRENTHFRLFNVPESHRKNMGRFRKIVPCF